MVSKPPFLGGGALWFGRDRVPLAPVATAAWDWEGWSEGEDRRLVAQCPGLGYPHHPGQCLQFRVGLPRPSVPGE